LIKSLGTPIWWILRGSGRETWASESDIRNSRENNRDEYREELR
jgi:hypothetical protein